MPATKSSKTNGGAAIETVVAGTTNRAKYKVPKVDSVMYECPHCKIHMPGESKQKTRNDSKRPKSTSLEDYNEAPKRKLKR